MPEMCVLTLSYMKNVFFNVGKGFISFVQVLEFDKIVHIIDTDLQLK